MTVIVDGPTITDTIEQSPLGEVYLTPDQLGQIVYTKYESQDPMLSDTMHGETWDDQFIEMESVGITEDMGCIVSVTGRSKGEVAIAANGEVISNEAAEMREEASGSNIPRFNAYDFRITKIEKTDGPEQKQALQRTHDQQRAKSEENMFDSISKAMSQAVIAANNGGNMAPSEAQIADYLASLAPGQRMEIIASTEDQIEEEPIDIEGLPEAE
tara:strand:+ start:1504 stop:2145 length:642 start_codon:yes stop_codon:yes gene_type:complete